MKPSFSLLSSWWVCITLVVSCLGIGNSQEEASVFKAGEAVLINVPLDTGSVLNGAFPIDSTGHVLLPLLGKVQVQDRSSTELEEYISKNGAQFLRDVHVSATPVVRITLLGYWQRPGMHYVRADANVWEACRLSGGPAGEINIQKWQVYRGSQILSVALLDEFSKGTSLRGAGVKSGDIFVIPVPNPQSGFWYWFRESLTVTSQIATITAAVISTYITYLVLEDRLNAQ